MKEFLIHQEQSPLSIAFSVHNIENILNQFTGENLISFFIKAFLLIFAFLYLMYSIALANETNLASKTLQTRSSRFFVFISFLHVPVAILLILLALLMMV